MISNFVSIASGKITKKGFRKIKKGNVQVFKCQECDRKFINNLEFENMMFDNKVIVGVMQMYFSSMSVRDIVTHYD